jgi:hypothetical protein
MATLIPINLRPSPKMLRQFGIAGLLGFGVLGLCAFLERGPFGFGLGELRQPVALGLWLVALTSLGFGLVFPKGNLPLYVLLTLITYPIGLILSPLILGLIFFGVLGPIALLIRVFGRDPLSRRYDPRLGSYWVERAGAPSLERYFRQY